MVYGSPLFVIHMYINGPKNSGRPNQRNIRYYSVFGSAVSGKTEPNIYRIKSKIKESWEVFFREIYVFKNDERSTK